jgi:hypothetical protein
VAGDPVAALRRLEALDRDFSGLRTTQEAAAEAARLRASSELARVRAEQQAAEADYSAYLKRAPQRLAELVTQDPSSVVLRLALNRLEVLDLERRAALPTYAGRAARRALEALFVQTGFYLPRAMTGRGEHARAAMLLSIAAAIKPEDPWVWYSLASAQARGGESRGAVASLRRAVAAGFADPERLAADEAFARLRDDRRFRALLAELQPRAGS